MSSENTFKHSNYIAAKEELEQLVNTLVLTGEQKKCIKKIIEHIQEIKKQEPDSIPELTEILKDTKALLMNEMTRKAYKIKAEKVQGSPSIAMKVLGGLMIALGTLITFVVGTLAAYGITLSGEGAVGAGILAAGIGLFAGGMRSGLSKAMFNLADANGKFIAPNVETDSSCSYV